MGSVLQPWVCDLTFMQQSVLICAVRGPDGIRKDHPVKVLLRWYRRCILYSAFEKKIFATPYELGGGSFTGPLNIAIVQDHLEPIDIDSYIDIYLRHVDELPHHFQLHLMHAAEILGYKHPAAATRSWWHTVYCKIVNDAHLCIETEEQMDRRLGDNEKQWRAAEEAVAL